MKKQFAFVLVLSVFASTTLAFQPPEWTVKENYDSRMDPSSSILSSVQGPTSEQVEALVALEARSGNRVRVYWNDFNATPKMLFADQSFLTSSSEENAETIAYNFLRDNQKLLGIGRKEIAQLKIEDQYTDEDNGVTHLYFKQEFDGIKVSKGQVAVHITREGQIALVSIGNVVPDLSPSITPRLSPREAVILAAEDIDPSSEFEPRVKSIPSPREAIFEPAPFGGLISDEISAVQVIFPTQGGGRLAWRVILDVSENPAWYQILVDAENGQILHRQNLVQYSQPQASIFLTNPDDNFQTTVAMPSAWVGAAVVTAGNAVLAGTNQTCPAAALPTTAPSGIQHWTFPFANTWNSTACGALGDVNASITNLFYWNNFMHDYMLNIGFTVPAGNFELLAPPGFVDRVIAHTQYQFNAPCSARNNAFFATPADGSDGTMVMLPFTAPPFRCADSPFDNDVIIHEYCHGLSNRLVGGRLDVTCLSPFVQSGGMGEGWGDFFAASINNNPVLGEYVTGDPINGIRNHNMENNPHDYQNTCVHGAGVHAVGEIWSAALWNLRTRFIQEYGPAGKNFLEKIILDGMKLSVCDPTFLQERDAMILADLLSSGGVNYCLLWNGFADFGMGVGAVNSTACTVAEDASVEVPAGCSGGLASNGKGELPAHYALYQNSPNPLNNETTIRYQTPQAVSVSLKIYNLSGREIRTLDKGDKLAGVYSLTWDRRDNKGERVSSGIYFYRLEAGKFIDTQKMVVLR